MLHKVAVDFPSPLPYRVSSKSFSRREEGAKVTYPDTGGAKATNSDAGGGQKQHTLMQGGDKSDIC